MNALMFIGGIIVGMLGCLLIISIVYIMDYDRRR